MCLLKKVWTFLDTFLFYFFIIHWKHFQKHYINKFRLITWWVYKKCGQFHDCLLLYKNDDVNFSTKKWVFCCDQVHTHKTHFWCSESVVQKQKRWITIVSIWEKRYQPNGFLVACFFVVQQASALNFFWLIWSAFRILIPKYAGRFVSRNTIANYMSNFFVFNFYSSPIVL